MKRKIEKFEKKCKKIIDASMKKKNGKPSLLKFFIYVIFLILFFPVFLIYDIITAFLGWLIIIPDDEENIKQEEN